ncbi:uncharacterized protein [Periplaneta americana]|uniref:uncharacterized protein isoform X3 n=1 Tax=Periplaneta americana TaxID=6978 RepID=UPI0037E8933F
MSCIKICLTTPQCGGPQVAEESSCALNIVFKPVAYKHLSKCKDVEDNHKTVLQDLRKNSIRFPVTFPVVSMLCDTLLRTRRDVTSEELEHHINSTYPVLHETALHLYINFLEHKNAFGTSVEKLLYADIKVTDLVQRLLEKRAVAFYGRSDTYLLLSQEGGSGHWECIGTSNEKPPLTLENCLSYDEIKLSAFLSVSSHSFFINDGNRDNCGVPTLNLNKFQNQGIIIGLIGARLESPGLMEWQELVVSDKQNTQVNGYGPFEDTKLHHWRKVWADFYGVSPHLPLYDVSLESSDRYTKLNNGLLFDSTIYKKRVAATAETLLLEAEHRAVMCGTNAYINVVGFGLGVWRVTFHQERLFLDAFAECLKRLSPVLKHVSDVHFLWFKYDKCGDVSNGGRICKQEDSNGICIHFSKGAPHARLEGEDAKKLLIVSYAWDGNALPGNEFWQGMLAASGDPAAACSTQITELHNPHINRGRVCGSNLHVVSQQWGILHISEYCRRKIQEAK